MARSYNFKFQPKEDITAIELARCLPLILGQVPPNIVKPFYDGLPENVARHWNCEEQSQIIQANAVVTFG